MAVYVNTNYSSLQGQRYLNNVQIELTTSYQRLSSGFRINSAKDDAAGLQISDRLTTQINGLNQGNRNASDGIALLQTIDGGIEEMVNLLQSSRTLAVQAANGTNTAEDRAALSEQARQNAVEIRRIAIQTKFGGKTILNGNAANSIYENPVTGGGTVQNGPGRITFQLGANQGDSITLNIDDFTMSGITEGYNDRHPNFADQIDVNAADSGFVPSRDGFVFDLTTADKAKNAIVVIDKLLSQVDDQRINIGVAQNRIESTIRNQSNVAASQADARSRIRDTDFAEESSILFRNNIIQQTATTMLMQSNSRPQMGLQLLG